MKHLYTIILVAILFVVLSACNHAPIDTTDTNASETYHQHKWSDPVCEEAQFCLSCEKKAEKFVEHRWSDPVCEQRQICLSCGKANTEKIEHEWSEPKCGEKQVCLKCSKESEDAVSHTTDRGICERCGEHYISPFNQLLDECARHDNALLELEEYYSKLYDKYYNEYVTYSSMVSHSESYINSRTNTLISTISDLQFDVSMAALDKSYRGTLKYNNLKSQLEEAQSEYQQLLQEKSYYDRINSCYENLIFIQNQYDAEVAKENQLFEENMNKINM